MINQTKRIIQRLTQSLGYTIVKTTNSDPVIEHDKKFLQIYGACKTFTMTSRERMYSLYQSVQYIIKANIPGDFVECGVWRGGSTMLIAHVLADLQATDRKIFLYDTFEGMTEPTEADRSVFSEYTNAKDKWERQKDDDHNKWCYASLSEVKTNMASTNYPEHNIVFVKGKVEETIPLQMPSNIALLRLDTDWYESTKHELIHLFPLLSNKGVLILDDYGHWAGSKQAVDEYFSDKPILLNKIDYAGRIGIKI